MPYAQWQVIRSPPWLLDDGGDLLQKDLGQAKDVLLDQVRQAVVARFPDYTTDDGLTLIGGDRQLPRGFRQKSADYAARLKDAWNLWPNAGSHPGILDELKTQGFWPAVVVQDNGVYSTLDGSGNLVLGDLGVSFVRGVPDWRFDLRDDFWSRFMIIFPGPAMPPVLQVTATAAFRGTSRASIVWSAPWDDSDYLAAVGLPIGGGAIPDVGIDETTVTGAGCDVISTIPWTGTVDLLSWLPGACPFCSPSVSTTNKLAELARLWKPGIMTYAGAVAIVEGEMWGWPAGTWGDPGTWGISTAVQIGP